MPAHELGRLHEHATRPAGRVEDLALVGLDDLHDQLHDRGRREVLPALLHVGRGELPHEVLEDQPVGIALDLKRRQQPQQFAQRVIGQRPVAGGQRTGQRRVRLGNGLHGRIQLRAEVCRPGQRQQPREPCRLRQVDRPAGLVVSRTLAQPALVLRRQLGFHLLELRLHLAQCDQRQHRLGILVRPQGRVGPELVRGLEQPLAQVIEVGGHGDSLRATSKGATGRPASPTGVARTGHHRPAGWRRCECSCTAPEDCVANGVVDRPPPLRQ